MVNGGIAHGGPLLFHPAAYPPSTGKIAPVIKRAASEQRNTAAPATSPGLPQRCIGVRPRMAADRLSSSTRPRVSSVAIQPGAMAFTRMPSAAQATASALVNCATPPLEAVYAGIAGPPKNESIDPVL